MGCQRWVVEADAIAVFKRLLDRQMEVPGMEPLWIMHRQMRSVQLNITPNTNIVGHHQGTFLCCTVRCCRIFKGVYGWGCGFNDRQVSTRLQED